MNEISVKLWAKTDATSKQWHPLLFHMLDASQVALVLWDKFFSPALQNRFTGWLGNNPEEISRTLSFWVALHDIGKASPAFQSKNIELQTGLIDLGLNFPKLCFPQHHGLVTYWALESLLPASGMTKKDSKAIARALAGHHGAWPTPLQTIDESKNENLGGDYFQTWEAARKDLYDLLYFLLNPLKTVSLPEDTEQRNAFLTLFSGFVSTADWIASMENMFPYADYRIPVSEYRLQSFSEAEQTVHQLGFDGWKADGSSLDFQNTFSFPPNKLQEKVLQTTSLSDLPAMLIVEAPTGCGKTEMAFSVADAWVQYAHGSGIYIAMPTMATSNSMFDRTKNDYLLKRYPNDRINLHLVHGAALLQDNFQNMIMRSVGENSESALAAMSWFLPHKRTLLASFAVGTVDQVFLSVLNTRHFFVRLFGLGGKVLIFDEVHAYDLYMQELFCRLLEWLRAAGVSVIILSATLPSQTRKELIKAYSGNSCSETNSDYPGFTLVDPQGSRSFPLPPDRSRNVLIHWINPETDSIISVLKDQLSDGGCAVVICNTIGRAQEIYEAIRNAGVCPAEFCWLFHARFTFESREALENKVVNSFGKKPDPGRPQQAVLVATQVVEQSLDLDFDVMISELAPIDLLIQRIGRLQRHEFRKRPAKLQFPQLFLCEPENTNTGKPDFGRYRYIYEPYILLRTMASLNEKASVSLPSETQSLIESVYSETNIPAMRLFAEDMINSYRCDMLKNYGIAQIEAKNRLILPPRDDSLLKMESDNLDEEDPAVHQSMKALTRLGDQSVHLICLHRLPNGELNTHPDGSGVKIRIDQVPDQPTQKVLLRTGVDVQNKQVVFYYRNKSVLSNWAKISALRYSYLAEFVDGTCRPEDAPFDLKLDPQLGLLIMKREVQ